MRCEKCHSAEDPVPQFWNDVDGCEECDRCWSHCDHWEDGDWWDAYDRRSPELERVLMPFPKGSHAVIDHWSWLVCDPDGNRKLQAYRHPAAGALVTVIEWDEHDWLRPFSCEFVHHEIPTWLDSKDLTDHGIIDAAQPFWVPRLRAPRKFTVPSSVAEANEWMAAHAGRAIW